MIALPEDRHPVLPIRNALKSDKPREEEKRLCHKAELKSKLLPLPWGKQKGGLHGRPFDHKAARGNPPVKYGEMVMS